MYSTATAPGRVPTALGVNVTVKVQLACAAREVEHGVAPPGTATKSPLPRMFGFSEVDWLLVIVTVCGALLVATVCAAKVSDVGLKVSGRAAVPFKSRICWPTVAVSVTATAPLRLPLEPAAGEKVTLSVQVLLALSTSAALQGVVPLPLALNSPLAAIELRVSALVLVFFTVTALAALVVPTTAARLTLDGVKVSGAVLPPDPVPVSATSCGLNVVPSVIVTAPETAPADCGANVTATLHLAFDASEVPQVVPLGLTA